MAATQDTLDKNLTVQDRIRILLDGVGQREIPITVEQLATRVGFPTQTTYQALHRLRTYGEIELEKEKLPNGREKIVGIKLIRLEPSGRTYKRAIERSGKITRISPQVILDLDTLDGTGDALTLPPLPKTLEYLNKKLAVERMKEQALSAGLDDGVINFDPHPQAEEAVLLLKLYSDLKVKYQELEENYRMRGYDLEAERRNVEALQRKLQDETRKDLMEFHDSKERE